MLDKLIEEQIITAIKVERPLQKTFGELVVDFESKYSDFNPIVNSFDICDYFGTGTGKVAATKKLIKDGKVKEEWLRNYETKNGNQKKEDFKGLYIFLNKDKPFYVGISKCVIGRIFNHTKGHSHNTSTLAYNIGLIRYEIMTGRKHTGNRNDLNFKTEVEPIKEFLLKQRIAFLPIENDEELYLFEIFCSMKLKTILNKFETH